MVGRLSRRYHAMSRVEISGILSSLTLLRRSAAFVKIFDVTEFFGSGTSRAGGRGVFACHLLARHKTTGGVGIGPALWLVMQITKIPICDIIGTSLLSVFLDKTVAARFSQGSAHQLCFCKSLRGHAHAVPGGVSADL